MSNIIIASSKEEKEKLLNIRIEQIKKKNAELLNKHKLIEEDKRQAELQGRTLKNIKTSIDENNEVNNRRKSSPSKMDRPEDKPRQQRNTIPVEPAYNFLFDKLRDGPNEKEARREKTRRHPRNYGGINFEDVPKKIQQERAKQNNHQHYCKSGEVDYTMVTTGKERREMDEWRKEREEIDRRRMQRQRKEDGGWKREWDQNKEPLEGLDHFARSSSGDEKYFPKIWMNKGSVGSQRHYNKIYHQKRKVKRNVSDPSCSLNERRVGNKSPQDSSKSDTTEHQLSSAMSPLEDLNKGFKRQSRNDLWRTMEKTRSSHQRRGKNGFNEGEKMNAEPTVPGEEDKVVSDGSHTSSPRKTVRFLEAAVERSNETLDKQEPVRGDSQQLVFMRTARNFIGSGRFSGGQKFRPRGHRYRRDFNAKSPDQPYHGRYGNQIRKVYLDEAMCKTVEVVVNPRQDSNNCLPPHSDTNTASQKDFHSTSDAEKFVKSDEKKSDDDEYEDDEDEQWEDIDEEVCLELNHGRNETNLNESSESLDQFIINNTLTLDPSESLSNNMRTLQTGQPGLDLLDVSNSSMGPQGGYPNVLDWEDDAESISHLSDMEKCNASESSVESNNSANVQTADDVQTVDQLLKAEPKEDSDKFGAEKEALVYSSSCVDESNVEESNVVENNVEESNVEKNNVEESNVEESNVEENNVEESNVEKNNVEENNVEENNVEESNVEKNNVEENNVEENNVGENNVDEKNILIKNTSDDLKGL